LTELTGIGIGETAAEGLIHRVETEFNPKPKNHSGSVEEQVAILKPAIEAIAAEMEALAESEEDGEIFEALSMLVVDEALFDETVVKIEEGLDAGTSFYLATVDISEILKDDPDFSERANDMLDLAKRVWAKTEGVNLELEIPEGDSLILVAEDFAPADTAKFNSSVKGVITKNGGPTSHVAILCRSKSIPALVGVRDADKLVSGQAVLIDPAGDRVVIGGKVEQATVSMAFIPEFDNPLIPVYGNVGSAPDAEKASTGGATGVGLFRTEFVFLNQAETPSQSEQAQAYQSVIEAAPKGEFIARTLDAGSDKPLPFLEIEDEENPALGIRGFRINDTNPQFSVEQLKALKSAGDAAGRAVSVMAPMVSSLSEAKEFAHLAREQGFQRVGIMVETPSIIFQLKHLEGVVDFLSIGTNDLSQYLFAADRLHPKLGNLLDVWQPALLEAISYTVEQADKVGIKVGVCGEAASDPLLAVVLAGIGVDTVSASPSQVENVTNALRAVNKQQASKIAQIAMSKNRASEARNAAKQAFAAR